MYPYPTNYISQKSSAVMIRAFLFWAVAACAPAATVYNEAVSGDLSNSGLSPTSVSVSLGSNQIFGTTGRGTGGTDRDYFTINVPSGMQISNVFELAGTQVGDVNSFIGVQSGARVTIPTNAATADGLLGWDHYGPTSVDLDILPEMGVPQLGSTGFSGPLSAGQYSFWIQDFGSGTFGYSFDVHLTATPEPGSCISSLGGLALLAGLTRIRQRKLAGKD